MKPALCLVVYIIGCAFLPFLDEILTYVGKFIKCLGIIALFEFGKYLIPHKLLTIIGKYLYALTASRKPSVTFFH